jgi:hypothetical protein
MDLGSLGAPERTLTAKHVVAGADELIKGIIRADDISVSVEEVALRVNVKAEVGIVDHVHFP